MFCPLVRNMDSKEGDDGESLIISREKLLKLQQKIEKANSELKASGSSASTSPDLQNLYKELQLLLMKTANANAKAQDPSKAVSSHIRDDLDKLFAVEEVGHSCNLCQRDLASDPERPNASLRSLQEACVLVCGHVYHYKCLRSTTPDLDNRSTNPSCIFCISYSN